MHGKCRGVSYRRHLVNGKHNTRPHRVSTERRESVAQRKIDFTSPLPHQVWNGVVKRLMQRRMPELYQRQVHEKEEFLNVTRPQNTVESFLSHIGTVVIRGLPQTPGDHVPMDDILCNDSVLLTHQS